MLNEPTVEKLKAMRLDALVAAWREQQQKPDVAKLPFDERFALLVDAEWLHRENKRLGRCLKEAKLRLSQACIEDIDYAARRELDRAVVRQLATCRWVTDNQNIVITGATGTGKTYLGCALAHQACRKGYRAIYRRASRLADELGLPASRSWSSTTGATRPCATRSVATSSRCSTTATASGRPS
jgi:DNA replication protein DnaC